MSSFDSSLTHICKMSVSLKVVSSMIQAAFEPQTGIACLLMAAFVLVQPEVDPVTQQFGTPSFRCDIF